MFSAARPPHSSTAAWVPDRPDLRRTGRLPGATTGPALTKTAPSRVTPADLGRVDAVLLSHDQHADNLDHSGRDLLAGVPLTLTTPGAEQRLGGKAKGLADWESVPLDRPDGGTVTVTGVPAIHGPGGSRTSCRSPARLSVSS